MRSFKKIIVLATNNKDKLAELRRLMKSSAITVLSLADFKKIKEAKETGKTFEENARIKARSYSAHTQLLTLSDDSGLMIDALNGKPGVYSARFAGPGCTYQDNCDKALRLLKNKKMSQRRAKFVSVIAIYYRSKPIGIARGECRGVIAQNCAGSHGFGYDPIFIPFGNLKTFAQMRPSEKNKISHRGRALQKAKPIILRFFKSGIK